MATSEPSSNSGPFEAASTQAASTQAASTQAGSTKAGSTKARSTKTRPAQWDRASRRRGSRPNLQAPVDVTVLRSGIPDTLPGRSVDLGEGGLGAVLAGELSPGESVGVEIQLPERPELLRTRASVRYHDKLRAGLEFIGLSVEQHAAIREWLEQTKNDGASEGPREASLENRPANALTLGTPDKPSTWLMRNMRQWIFLLLSVVILFGVAWGHWNRGWQELEANLPNQDSTEIEKAQVHVSAEEMQRLVRHRVDPDYPDAARPAKLQGVIALDVVVRKDGTVADVHALNGPDVLAQAAMNAMRWWRFEPYRVSGQPVAVETTVAVEFKP